jgi:hypothetical protein
MLNRSVLAGLFLVLYPHASLRAQGIPSGNVGWYNGDWQTGIPGQNNFYVSAQQFGRVYDDFVVPDGGWTVIGAFSHNSMSATGVTQASWEIRSGVSAGNAGTLVASGVSPATQTLGPSVGGGTYVYLIQVSGLAVDLAPGRYWLSVTPVTSGTSYVCATLGANASGNPPGKYGGAFYYSLGPSNSFFTPLQAAGQGGISGDFSQGIMISGPWIGRELSWQSDITSLAQQMESLNEVPFPGVGLGDFDAAAANLAARVPSISDAEVRTGLQALVASIGIAHDDVEWPAPSPFRYLPLSFYWFDDGIYVTNAAAQYQNLLGGKLVSVDQTPADATIQLLSPLVAHDNDSWLKYMLMFNKLTNTDFLFGTGVTQSTDGAQIQVQTASGDLTSANVQALSQFPPLLPVFHGNLPLYRQHPDKYYWATVIDGGATVYFQYNQCMEDPTQASAAFLAQLSQMLAQPGVGRVIVDMRNNTGGDVRILDPWIEQIKSSRYNTPGRLYVIVGRATFSAAMEAIDHFRDETAAIFVGEPTGAKPQFVYRVGDFPLPFFGLRVSYGSGTETAKDPGPALVPDIQTGLTSQQYMNGDDPAMDAILSNPAPQ